MMKTTKYYETYIGIILTYQCNLNCCYCYIPEKKDLYLSLDTAKEILTPYLTLEDAEPIEIDFMGAEPLSSFDRLKEIVEWTKAQGFPRQYLFFATTNGTLLNDEMKEWFAANKDIIILGLSYDGTDESQDKNRSGSSVKIDMDYFLKTWPFQAFKCTIPQHSVKAVADGLIRLAEKGAYVNANPAYEQDDWCEESVTEYGKQLKRIVQYYSEHPDVPVASLVDYDLIGIYSRKDQKQRKNCGAAKGEGVYDISGHCYPCQMLSPLVMDEQEALAIQKIIKDNDDDAYRDKKCENCIIRNDCPTCMATNYRIRKSFAQRDFTHCQLTKLEVLATCVLQKNRLLQKKEPTEEDAFLAKAICEIYKSLKQQ